MSRKVLIVDDSQVSADLIGKLIFHLGYEVRILYDSQLAIDVMQQFQPDTVLIDLVMPDLDGFDIARAARERFGKEITLIAFTAFADSGLTEEVLRAGFDSILIKPATPDQLKNLLLR